MRSKKAFYNMTVSLLYQVIAMICGLITPRLILSAFGSSYNGVVSSATQFMSMISILTLGIAGATRVELYKTLANKDTLGTSRIVKATSKYMRKVALAIIAYSVVLMIIYPFISHNDLQPYESAILIGIVSFGSFMEYFFGNAYNTLLTADQSEYVASILRIISTVLNTVLVFILIKCGCDIFVVKAASALAFALTPFGMSIYVKKKYHLVTDCAADETALKQRGAVAMHSIANIVHDNTDVVLLTIFTDAKIISVYTVYYLVIGKIKMLMRVFTSGLEAAFGNMWAKKEYATLEKRFSTFEFAMFSFTTVVFTCVGFLIVPFITLYTDSVTDVNYIRPMLAFLITVAEALFCIRQPYMTLVQAAGFYEETKKGAALEAIVNLCVSIVLVNLIGINGVIVGTLIANLIRTSQYAWFVYKKIINKSLWRVMKRLAVMLANVILVSLIVCSALDGLMVISWWSWMVKAFLVFLTSAIVTMISSVIFYREDIAGMCGFVKKMFKRKTK